MAPNVRPAGGRILVEALEEKENTEIKLGGKAYKILNSDEILSVID